MSRFVLKIKPFAVSLWDGSTIQHFIISIFIDSLRERTGILGNMADIDMRDPPSLQLLTQSFQMSKHYKKLCIGYQWLRSWQEKFPFSIAHQVRPAVMMVVKSIL